MIFPHQSVICIWYGRTRFKSIGQITLNFSEFVNEISFNLRQIIVCLLNSLESQQSTNGQFSYSNKFCWWIKVLWIVIAWNFFYLLSATLTSQVKTNSFFKHLEWNTHLEWNKPFFTSNCSFVRLTIAVRCDKDSSEMAFVEISLSLNAYSNCCNKFGFTWAETFIRFRL